MITLFKGDDTHGQLGKKCFIKFHCDDAVDMTNVRVRFNLINIVTKDFENVHDGSELEIFISHQDARKLPLGVTHGKLWGEDSSGKIRTFANRIPFIVTTDLRKVYGSDGLDSVDIHVYASVDWDSVANKPTLFPSKVSMVEGLEEALKQAGKVKTVNGRSPDEKGNIEIELPSCKVTSVNGKDGDVEIMAHDIPFGGEGTSNIETAIEQNTQAAVDNANAIDSLEQQVGELKSDTYTKNEVDERISQNAAHYLTAKVNGEFVQFATHAALAAAKAAHTEANPQFWYGDDSHTPDKNDYCIVLDDETHGHATTRYMFVGVWPDGFFRYQYTVNETALTQAQWDALNSGATKEKIDAIDNKLDKTEGNLEAGSFGLADGSGVEGFFVREDGGIYIGTPTGIIEIPGGTMGDTMAVISDIPDVIDPATATTTGKAADAKKVAEALAGKATAVITDTIDHKIVIVSGDDVWWIVPGKVYYWDDGIDGSHAHSPTSVFDLPNAINVDSKFALTSDIAAATKLTPVFSEWVLGDHAAGFIFRNISATYDEYVKGWETEEEYSSDGGATWISAFVPAKGNPDPDGTATSVTCVSANFIRSIVGYKLGDKTTESDPTLNGMSVDDITKLAEAAVEDKITTENASLVALIKKYGGTQIKEDKKGFYYEVEEA